MIKSKFFRNLSFLMFSNIYIKFTTLIIVPFIAYRFTVQEFGILNLTQSLLAYILILFNTGIRLVGVRNLAGKKEKEGITIINEIFSLRIFLSIIAFIVMCLIGLIIFNNTLDTMIVVIIALYLIPQILDITWVYDAWKKMKVTAYFRIFERTIFVIASLVGIYLLNIYLVSLSYFIASLIAGIWFWIFFKKFPIHIIFSERQKKYLKNSIIIGFSSTIFALCISIDQFMVNFFLGKQQLGLYCGATKFISVVSTFAWVYYYVLFPVLCDYHNNQQYDLIRKFIKKHTILLGILITCLTTLLCVLAKPIITLILSKKYLVIIPLYKVFMIALIVTFYNTIYSDVLNVFGKEKLRLYVTIVSLSVNIVLNIIFIPMWGKMGAAFSSIIAQAIILIASYQILTRIIKLNNLLIIIFFVMLNIGIVYLSL